MRTHVLAASLLAAVMLSPWAAVTTAAQEHSHPAAPAMACRANHDAAAPVAMPCCADHQGAAQKPMACCADHRAPARLAMACCSGDDAAPAMTALAVPEKPEVQTLAVTFRDAVQVGDVILMGRYVIEHDDARMARGEPCTHIYEAADPGLPVVRFHCTHLERPAAASHTVVLRRGIDNAIKQLTGFQFAGETAVHGVPAGR